MSKGPGKWQRAILDELGRREWFYLSELLPEPRTRSTYVALLRAACNLSEDDAQIIHYMFAANHPRRGHIVITRPGFPKKQLDLERKEQDMLRRHDRALVRRERWQKSISVDFVPSVTEVNT